MSDEQARPMTESEAKAAMTPIEGERWFSKICDRCNRCVGGGRVGKGLPSLEERESWQGKPICPSCNSTELRTEWDHE